MSTAIERPTSAQGFAIQGCAPRVPLCSTDHDTERAAPLDPREEETSEEEAESAEEDIEDELDDDMEEDSETDSEAADSDSDSDDSDESDAMSETSDRWETSAESAVWENDAWNPKRKRSPSPDGPPPKRPWRFDILSPPLLVEARSGEAPSEETR